MTQLKFDILTILHENQHGKDRYEFLNCGLAEPEEMERAMRDLIAAKHVYADTRFSRYYITPPGTQELESEEDRRDQLAKDRAAKEADKRSDRRFQMLNTVVSAFLGFAFGLLAEHFVGILEFAIRLAS